MLLNFSVTVGFLNNFFIFNTCLLLINIFLQIIFLFFSSFNFKLKNNKYSNLIFFIKFCSSLFLIISWIFVIFIFIFYFYFFFIINNLAFNINYFLELRIDFMFIELQFYFDLFSIILLIICYSVGIFSFFSLDNRIFWKQNKYFSYFNIFVIITYFLVSTQNIILLFILYELLLIPSTFLVYFISPNKRALQASIYFLIWTQIGSFFVALGIFYVIVKVNSLNFFVIKQYKFSINEVYTIFFLLFLGFGVKVPIWPFHYWLTKTHVEAPAGFSIFLSGFLVKTALFCFFKLVNLLNLEINTFFFLTIVILGIVDSSIKMWSQTDLKKLVAYGTIQEMNIIYLTFLFGDTKFMLGGLIFCFTHAILSSLMFFLVDCIQRRYHSRSVLELSGILHTTPNLGISVFIMCLFFFGLPGTLKFTSEFIIFSSLLEIDNLSFFFIIIFSNFFGVIGFSKVWFNCLFGLNPKTFKFLPIDLNIKEIYFIYFCFALLILPNFIFIIL